MEEQLISFETAKLAKEKGFYTGTHNIYEWQESYEMVPQSLLQKWLREVHKLHLNIVYSHDHNKYSVEGFDEFNADELRKRNPRSKGRFPYPYQSKFKRHYWNYKTYEEALEYGLQEALKLI